VQVRALRRQVENLQAGLARAKGDLEAARKHKDKTARTRAAVDEENTRLSRRIAEVGPCSV
jgi:capsular polysaccharide biosynthesis protein